MMQLLSRKQNSSIGCTGSFSGTIHRPRRGKFNDQVPLGDWEELALRDVSTCFACCFIDAGRPHYIAGEIHDRSITLHSFLGCNGGWYIRDGYSSWQAIRRQTEIIIVVVRGSQFLVKFFIIQNGYVCVRVNCTSQHICVQSCTLLSSGQASKSRRTNLHIRQFM